MIHPFGFEFILFIIVPALLGLWAQTHVGGVYAKWSRVGSRSGMTGAEVARAIMRSAGIDHVEIVPIPGHLTDHYDAHNKRLALSAENFHGTSLAALGVAAHESGHAIQDKEHFAALEMRLSLLPITNFASSILPLVILGGLVFEEFGLISIGIVLYLILAAFQLVTMPSRDSLIIA